MTHVSLVRSLERMYESAVMEPEAFEAEARAEELFSLVEDREQAKRVRRALRVAMKLAAFWQQSSDPEPDWVRRVDQASGPPAWRPLLEIAQLGLDVAPDAEVFELVQRLFPVVHYERWMDGIGFDQWLTGE